MFTDKIDPIIYNGVANIGGKDLIPKWICTVSWSWTDDEGQIHTNKLKIVLYFPDPPANILSETALYESMKDNKGLWVPTKIKYSIFIWDFGKYKKTMSHSENCLPESDIQASFRRFDGFCKRLA